MRERSAKPSRKLQSLVIEQHALTSYYSPNRPIIFDMEILITVDYYSTVTDLARFLGLSISNPFCKAI